jgi:hypothetical protein
MNSKQTKHPSDNEYLERARRARQAQVKSQIYRVEWRGGEVSEVQGWEVICALLGMRRTTLQVYLSKGGGSFQRLATNPTTGEQDILIVTRVKQVKEPKRRGRPPKAASVDRYASVTTKSDAPRKPGNKIPDESA